MDPSSLPLLNLRALVIAPEHPLIRASVQQVLSSLKGSERRVCPASAHKTCDVGINGLLMNGTNHFSMHEAARLSVVGFLWSEHMADGACNRLSYRSGAVIRKDLLLLACPPRWKHKVFRALNACPAP